MKKVLIFDKVALDILTEPELESKIGGWIEDKRKKKIFYLNVHSLIKSFENNEFLSCLSRADLVYADGWGPVIAAKYLNGVSSERLNAADTINGIFNKLDKNGCRVYLMGGTDNLLAKTEKAIKNKYKGINIVGVHNGFYKKMRRLQ
jgi:N-acetylglucosaminyldiphosphoundecaprenol N-acetyl-beta-D-mannosaminyltransferase